MGMNAGGSFMGAASAANMQQMQMQQQYQQPNYSSQPQHMYAGAVQQPQQNGTGWTCSCGAVNNGNFCTNCGSPKPASASWTCSCGAVNTGNFCTNCGSRRP